MRQSAPATWRGTRRQAERWGALLCLAVGLAAVAAPACAQEAPKLELPGVRILLCSGYFDLLAIPAVQRLKAAGAEVRGGNLSTLTWEQASQYHMIITVEVPEPRPAAAGAGPVEVLERFAKAGGGVLFYKNFYDSEAADKYLAPFGASIPHELVQDPAHSWKAPLGFGFTYAYTTKVLPGHPITEGVKTVWYPARREYMNHTWPITVDGNWQVLVTGEPEASSIWVGGLHEEAKWGPGAYASAPPLVAARTYGQGGLVLMGISPFEMLMGQGLPAYMDILLEKGNSVIPSDTGRLYTQAVNWLGARALAAATGEPGGDRIGQGELEPVDPGFGKPSLVDWSAPNVNGGDTCTKPARGVIGVHSTLSDGRATPEAMIAKAQALGLDWLAFTERLEDFSPEKWEQLRRICREASGPGFSAQPGLDYADESGTRYVVFGDFNWPPEAVFSADKQRIVVPQWWFNVGMTPLGPYDLSHAPLRPWDLSMYSLYPIRTTIDGRQVDEDLEGFRYVQGCMDDPFPMAVDLCRDEAELEAASGRMLTYVLRDMPVDVAKHYRDYAYYGGYLGFASDGPVVTGWRAINETRHTGGAWWLPGTEFYRVRLAARSEAPITEVKVYDGPILYRRFLPNQEAVVLTFDAPHDMQHNLYAEITDAAGKRAITGGLSIRDWNNYRFMCADRGNSICDAVQVDEYGAYLTGPTAPYQRKMTAFGVLAGYGERHFNILPPYFDGGMRPIGMHVMPWVQTPGFELMPPETTPEARNQIAVCSRDGLLQGDDIVGYFPGTADAWQRKPAPRDVEGLRISYRYLNLTPRAHDPGVILLEGKVHFEKAMRVEGAHVFRIFHSAQPGEGDHYAISLPDTVVSGLGAATQYNVGGKAAPGSYAVLYPSLWGSTGVIVLDEGYTLGLSAKTGSGHMSLSLSDLPREMQAGEELTYRYVLMHGPSGELPNTAFWERFVTTMGFRGDPAYQVAEIKAGTVKGTKFLLELVPTEGAFVGTVSGADLPVRLPVRVANMNPNYTFGWFDLDRREWYPSAIDRQIQQGFFSIDTRRGRTRLFAGHPVLCSDPEVRVAVFSDAKTKVEAELNNVTDEAVTVTVRLNPALGEAAPQAVTLAPGELKRVSFAWTPG